MILAAQFLAARKKETLFLCKSLPAQRTVAYLGQNYLRKQVFVGLRSRKICVPAVEKVCNLGKKVSCAFRDCDSRRKQLRGFFISRLRACCRSFLFRFRLANSPALGIRTTRYGRFEKISSTFCVFLLTGFFPPLILQLQIRGIVKAPDRPSRG